MVCRPARRSSGHGVGVLVGVQQERVVGGPPQVHRLPRAERVVRTAVLLEHRELLAPRHPDEVLGADADEADVADDTAGEHVGACRSGRLRRLRPGPGQEHLLRSDPQPHRSLGTTGAGPRRREGAAVGLDDEVVATGRDHGGPDQVGLPQEVRDEGRRGVVVQLRRAAHLVDHPLVHDRDGVGHRHGLLLVVGDVHERDADLGLDPLQLDLHLPAQLQVERAQRLVEQQDLGAVDEGARQRHPLLLPTGQLGGTALLVAAQLDELEHVVDLAPDFADAAATQAERHVLEDVEVREQRVALEDRVHRALVGAQPADVPPRDRDGARRRLLEPRDHPQRGGLAAAGGSQKGEEAPLLHEQVQGVHSGELPEPLGHRAQAQVGACLGRVAGPLLGVGVGPGGHRQAPITAANCCWYLRSLLWSRAMNPWDLDRSWSLGKISSLSARLLSIFVMASRAPCTGQM